MAPVAAWLTHGLSPDEFGPEVKSYRRLRIKGPVQSGREIVGEILYQDRFGNLMTNLTLQDLPQAMVSAGKVNLHIGGKTIQQLVQTYAQGNAGEPFAILGSSGFLEISVNKGSAARVLGVQRGAEVTLELA